jgi:hypothetical protein
MECAEHAETFWTLLGNAAHWQFELFLMILFDVVIGAIAWPFVKRQWQTRERKRHEDCCPE